MISRLLFLFRPYQSYNIKLLPMKTEHPLENCHTTGNIALRVGITGAGLLTLFYSMLKVFVTAISLL